jgi:hypothetical protein
MVQRDLEKKRREAEEASDVWEVGMKRMIGPYV